MRNLTLKLIAGILLCIAGFSTASAEQDVAVSIPLIAQRCNERVAAVQEVQGRLRLPDSPVAAPAVVIFHSNAGVVGVGDNYAKRLVENGFVTLEVDSYAPRSIVNGNDRNAPTACDRLNDAWSALYFLSQQPQVDISKVGVIGLSSGGLVALMLAKGVFPRGAASQDSRLQAIRKMRYKKFFVLYPSCANILYDEKMKWMRNPNMPRSKRTDGDLLLVVGTNDDYEIDAKTDCPKVIEEWSSYGLRGALHLVDGATHAFDWPTPPPPGFSRFAKAGKGSFLTMVYSEKAAQETEKRVTEFFMPFKR
jgi:dienelactone hydrolase